ncbi:hypothetical protein NMK44_05375, partial [Streptomyces sp. NEAU-Y11]|nr:hypothetical protein [Streptomyces sp. NEAU-Y11]
MIPDSIEFNDDERRLLVALLGQMPLQASSDLAFSSSNPFEDWADRVVALRDTLTDLVNKVDGALPPAVARQYKEAMAPLIGGNGSDPLSELAQQLRGQLAKNQIQHSRNIMESKFEIIAEIILLMTQLAIIAALSFFTGGLSFSEGAAAKARSTVAILMTLDRLLRSTHLLPSFSEALEEAFTTFAVRLAMLTLNDGDRRPDGIDWGNIGKSAAFGALAGFFASGLSQFIGNIFKHQFKNFGDNKWAKFGGEIFRAFASEGPGESAAEVLINGAFEGKWKFDPMTLWGGGVSAVSELLIETAIENIAKDLNNKFFGGRNIFTTHNPLPGPESVLGGGSGHGGSKTSTPPAAVPTPHEPPPVTTTPTVTPPTTVTPPVTAPVPTTTAPTPVDGDGDGVLDNDPITTADPYADTDLYPDSDSESLYDSDTESIAGSDTTFDDTASDITDWSDYEETTPFADTDPATAPLPTGKTGATTPDPLPDTIPASLPDTTATSRPDTTASPLPHSSTGDTTSSPSRPRDLDRSTPETTLPGGTLQEDTTPEGTTPGEGTLPDGTPDTTADTRQVPSGRPATGPADATHGSHGNTSPATTQQDSTRQETGDGNALDGSEQESATSGTEDQDAVDTAPAASGIPAESDRGAQTRLVDPVRDPVRPEQWRSHQQDASDPFARPGSREASAADTTATDQDEAARTAETAYTPEPLLAPHTPTAPVTPVAGPENAVRPSVQRVQADDGRWVRQLSLELPVRFAEGSDPAQLQSVQDRLTDLLDTHVNHGLPLPRSGDQLHVELKLVDSPDHPGAVELSTSDTPPSVDQLHVPTYSEGPATAPAEQERRRRDDTAALRRVMRYTGLTDGYGETGPDGLPGPAVPLEQLRTIEDATEPGGLISDDLAPAAPPVAITTSSDGPRDRGTPAPAPRQTAGSAESAKTAESVAVPSGVRDQTPRTAQVKPQPPTSSTGRVDRGWHQQAVVHSIVDGGGKRVGEASFSAGEFARRRPALE